MGQIRNRQRLSPARRVELLLAGSLYYSGLVRFSCWRKRRQGPSLTILCYHNASGGYLREQLLYLRRHYRLLHLEEALDELFAAGKESKSGQDRRPPLVLTFDDGYRDFYTYAWPLARELQTPLTCFLVPGYIESGKRFWWFEPAYLLEHTRRAEVTFQEQTHRLNDPGERAKLRQVLEAGVRFVPSVAAREAFLQEARMALGVPISSEQDEEEQLTRPVNWEEVREMDASEWASFGAHTMYHPILAYLSDSREAQSEVSACRAVLEQKLGHQVRAFAYPVGKNEHIGTPVVQTVQGAAYQWAVTTLHGLNTPDTNPHFLARIVVDVDQHWLMVAAKTSGLWDFLVHLGRKPLTFLRGRPS